MGFINDKHEFIHTNNIAGIRGKDGVGFGALTPSGDYDMNGKAMYNIKTQADVPDDSDFESIKRDYESGVNKEYLINHFLKRDKTGVYYDLRGLSIQNSEEYDSSSWNNKTLITKGYADLRDNLKADKTELAKKADLETSDDQTFKGILNVPDFDPGYSNMNNVMNKRYIDTNYMTKTMGAYFSKIVEDTYLSRKSGGTMENSISFDSLRPVATRQIHNLAPPQYSASATNRSYVDGVVQNKADVDKVMLLDGTQAMQADLDMNSHKITGLDQPTNDLDVANKKYVDSHIDKNIQSSNDNNVFEYVMNDPDSQLSEEDDIELGGITTYNSSPHQVNKNVADMKLLLDSSKGYYSSRLGINLYPLENGDYTICFELFWIDPFVNTIFMNGVSSIETIHNVNKKIFLSQKYARLICQFTKSQNIGNNYLYIDLEIKLNSGKSHQPKFQTFFVIYGIDTHQSDVNSSLYDAMIHYQNGYVFFNTDINMFGKKIIGIKEDIDDSGAVNFKQLKNLNDALKISIENKIKSLQTKSYYCVIFETFFYITNPNSFIVADTYGAEVQYVKCQNDNGFIVTEYMKDDFNLSLFDKKLGAVLNGVVVSLNKAISTNKYTILISFEHDTNYKNDSKNLVGFGALTPNKKFIYSDPRYSINDRRLIINNQNDNNHQLSILTQYKNKNLFMWIMKNGNNVRYGLVNGPYLDKTINVRNVTSRNIIIEFPYKIQRIGISTNAYSFSSKEFNKICFLERGNGVNFV